MCVIIWGPIVVPSEFRAELKVMDLRWWSPICSFLQNSSVFCENLRFSAVSCSLQMLDFSGEEWTCENQRFSAKICVLGSLSLCHLRSVTLSSPWAFVNDNSYRLWRFLKQFGNNFVANGSLGPSAPYLCVAAPGYHSLQNDYRPDLEHFEIY